ncbi:hypothetical protein LPW11_00830 [Geomonas sp. RF6]|uniref:hypothetical protein n=1 Tax=Geomonas sp. RF6 TaxID=2897342 RepID=UPI001E404540|nr:hypothetical protein [Geomonas sp. RF6]UFS70748.1 hypothetical protein LPW11_00830 [Geomonas sp. RF6]
MAAAPPPQAGCLRSSAGATDVAGIEGTTHGAALEDRLPSLSCGASRIVDSR